MLVIRKQQMQVFEDTLLDSFVEELVPVLRAEPEGSEAVFGDAELRQWIRAGVALARRHGIVQADLIERMLVLMLWAGGPFDAEPQASWAMPVLRSQALTPARKILELEERLFESEDDYD